MNNNKLGIYLQMLRKQNNYTQAFVAQHIGVIRQTYSHYETGRVCPTISALCRLTDLYEIPIETFLETMNDAIPQMEPLYQLSPKEQQLIRYHRQLTEQEQEDMIDLIEMLAKKKRNRK